MSAHADPATSAKLGQGLVAAWCIDADGNPWPWVLTRETQFDHGCTCRDCAPHEQPGPMPARWVDRVATVTTRCGQPCADGHRCRTPVAIPGGTCHWHTTQRPAPSSTHQREP